MFKFLASLIDGGIDKRLAESDPYGYGLRYLHGGFTPESSCPQDYQKAAFYFAKASQRGDIKAIYQLGLMYDQGLGFEADTEKAIAFIGNAALNGLANAQFWMGTMYESAGDSAALEWYGKAAAQGDKQAEKRLEALKTRATSSIFTEIQPQLNDDGTPIQSEAVLEFRRQAIAGDMEGQRMLGQAYMTGNGIMQDYFYALYWLLKAAAQGSSDAQLYIGAMHEAGKGTPKDSLKAMQWYVQAAENGNVMAQHILATRQA